MHLEYIEIKNEIAHINGTNERVKNPKIEKSTKTALKEIFT